MTFDGLSAKYGDPSLFSILFSTEIYSLFKYPLSLSSFLFFVFSIPFLSPSLRNWLERETLYSVSCLWFFFLFYLFRHGLLCFPTSICFWWGSILLASLFYKFFVCLFVVLVVDFDPTFTPICWNCVCQWFCWVMIFLWSNYVDAHLRFGLMS